MRIQPRSGGMTAEFRGHVSMVLATGVEKHRLMTETRQPSAAGMTDRQDGQLPVISMSSVRWSSADRHRRRHQQGKGPENRRPPPGRTPRTLKCDIFDLKH